MFNLIINVLSIFYFHIGNVNINYLLSLSRYFSTFLYWPQQVIVFHLMWPNKIKQKCGSSRVFMKRTSEKPKDDTFSAQKTNMFGSKKFEIIKYKRYSKILRWW